MKYKNDTALEKIMDKILLFEIAYHVLRQGYRYKSQISFCVQKLTYNFWWKNKD